MKILVTGSSGLVGSELVPFLTDRMHQVVRLVRVRRKNSETDTLWWNPDTGALDVAHLDGFDAVVHLAGESIAAHWSAQKKQLILDSRIKSTRLLCESLAKLSQPPKVVVSASAIGYYGNRGDEPLPEQSMSGTGFLSEVCAKWELATDPATERGIRVVTLRFGMILSANGGALAKMLPAFRLGLGGVVGNGQQYWSWIAIDDAVRAIHHAILVPQLAGPTNAVSPNPVHNREFTKTLGKVLGRPTIFPLPAFAARVVLGQMGDELLLASARVEPAKLLATTFKFNFPDLEPALRHLLGK
jgi:uncharacterized protein (TIGR01777 family)